MGAGECGRGRLRVNLATAGVALLLLVGRAPAETFFDDFNRPDSATVGNGWSNALGSFPSNLAVRNNELAGTAHGQAGIYRPFEFSTPITISATLQDSYGNNGPHRYNSSFSLANNGDMWRGYGLHFGRSDSGFNNSTITLFDVDGHLDNPSSRLASVAVPFQFGSSFHTQFTISPSGRVMGSVTQGSDHFSFSLAPPASYTIQSAGNNFAYTTEPGVGPTYSRLDNLGLESGPPSPVPPTMYAVLGGAADPSARGDLDSQAIRNALLRFPGARTENLRLATTRTEFEGAMADIATKIRPQDSLVVYFSGHGYYNFDTSETPVRNGFLARRETGNEFNVGDDMLDLGEGISDDQLAAMLSSTPELLQAKKTVFLDSCFSGGFWGRAEDASDQGDLDGVQNVALLASAEEGDLSFSVPGSGRGFFSIALEATLDDMAAGGTDPSFASLLLALNARYINSSFPNSGLVRAFPWLDEPLLIDVEEALGAASLVGGGYDPDASFVPEPIGAAYLLSAFACILCRPVRRGRVGPN
jgi:hypothetical protein